MAHEYISQVSEEIEGRVTKKLSQEFSRTESRILGALSKLDEFLLNPQVRTCSVAVPRTSRNSGSENREPTGRRSLGDPCPEAVFSTYHSSNLNDSEQEETHHSQVGRGTYGNARVEKTASGEKCKHSMNNEDKLLINSKSDFSFHQTAENKTVVSQITRKLAQIGEVSQENFSTSHTMNSVGSNNSSINMLR